MKIKTITCHDVYNYGASLQAYALQKYLSKLTHNVEIIDYLPDYLLVNYRVCWKRYNVLPESRLYKYRSNFLVDFAYRVKKSFKKIRFIIEKHGRKVAFDKFKRERLICTDRTYSSCEEMREANLQADLFIAGSDQIWNPLFTNGRDPSFYLQFTKAKKISYAASFGVSLLGDEDRNNMRKWISSFSAVSVREKTGIKLLKSLGLINGVQVCDPVFLLNKEEWLKIESNKYNKDPKIVVYNLGELDPIIKECALSLSRKTGYKIYSIEERGNINYADIRVKNAGPSEFIELFGTAAHVVTNSFHATAFSIIFNIDFYTFIKNNTSSRIVDVLTDFGLQQRLNSKVYEGSIDWRKISDRTDDYKAKGVNYLKDQLKL